MKQRIVLVEDDREIGSWLHNFLIDKQYTVEWLTSGERLIEEAAEADLIILDVMLPGLDGFSLARRLKKEHSELPVLMLSARTAIDDKLQGLQFADDYVTKPFHPDELAARIEVQLRRYMRNDPEHIELKHLSIYPQQNRIIDHQTSEEISLTGKQFHIFMYLFRNANQILTKEQIYESVWGDPYIEGDKTLMVHIRHLREKLERDPSQPELIETIRGIGYRVKR
ncbi:response regulator transcription factor [Paenibacillus marinisediminis]